MRSLPEPTAGAVGSGMPYAGIEADPGDPVPARGSRAWLAAGTRPRDDPTSTDRVLGRLRGRARRIHSHLRRNHVKKTLIALALVVSAAGAYAQAGTAVKEAGKATAETMKQGKENTEAAMTSEPKKTMHKAKAKAHKAKAKAHKEAAKEATK
jgi:hypothetical protein